MGKLRKEWTDAKKRFEALDLGKVDPKKYLSKKDLGPTLDKAEAAHAAADKKDGDAKLAKAAYDLADAASVIAALYERDLVFLMKEIAKTDRKAAAEIDKVGDALGSIVIQLDAMRTEAKRLLTATGADKNAPVRKAVESGIKTAVAALKATVADPDFSTWNKVMPPALAPLMKALELSGPMTRDFAPALKKHMEKRDPKQAGTDMGRSRVLADAKDVQDRLKAIAGKLDVYLPKK